MQKGIRTEGMLIVKNKFGSFTFPGFGVYYKSSNQNGILLA